MRVRIYIAGPMTGYENFNREAFHRAEDALKREGHTVLNPAVLPDGLTQPHYMDICMAMLRCVDAVYMLKGWQQSAGARAELALAEKLGHAVIFQEVGIPVKEDDPRNQVNFLYESSERPYCHHASVRVDEKERQVRCKICGAVVRTPFF